MPILLTLTIAFLAATLILLITASGLRHRSQHALDGMDPDSHSSLPTIHSMIRLDHAARILRYCATAATLVAIILVLIWVIPNHAQLPHFG